MREEGGQELTTAVTFAYRAAEDSILVSRFENLRVLAVFLTTPQSHRSISYRVAVSVAMSHARIG